MQIKQHCSGFVYTLLNKEIILTLRKRTFLDRYNTFNIVEVSDYGDVSLCITSRQLQQEACVLQSQTLRWVKVFQTGSIHAHSGSTCLSVAHTRKHTHTHTEQQVLFSVPRRWKATISSSCRRTEMFATLNLSYLHCPANADQIPA